MSDSENEYEDQDENNLEEIEQDLINETSDASREDEDAIQNISLKAHDMGLGSVIVGSMNHDNIAKIIDLLTMFVKVILIAIVLVSIMNVMLMAVYERIREIGTIAAIGTSPGKIWSLFLMEGFFLGLFGAVVGSIVSLGIIQYLNWQKLTVSFGRQDSLILEPSIAISEVITTALIVIVISALASLQPAVKASKLEPVEALRHF